MSRSSAAEANEESRHLGQQGALQEVKSRAERIETRLTRLCLFLGMDPTRNKDVFTYDRDTGTVYASGFDVSIGDLLTFLRTRGISRFNLGVQGKVVIAGELTE